MTARIRPKNLDSSLFGVGDLYDGRHPDANALGDDPLEPADGVVRVGRDDGGGGAGGPPAPTGYQFFTGSGTVPGNTIGWDNLNIELVRGDPPCPSCDPCDMNCDTEINALDIEFYIDLLFNNADPCCGIRGEVGSTGDVNLDGRISAADIEGFIDCLFSP